jgi:hypothetical protein
MNSSNLIPLHVYGHEYQLSPEDIARQLRIGVIQLVIEQDQKYIRVLNETIARSKIQHAVQPEEHQATHINQTGPNTAPPPAQQDSYQEPFSMKKTMSLIWKASLPIFIFYLITAFYGFYEVGNELNGRRGTTGTIMVEDIRSSILKQVHVDYTQVTPTDERERLALARRMFNTAEISDALRSLDGLRSIISTGQVQDIYQSDGIVTLFTWLKYIKPTGISSFAVVIQSPGNKPIEFIFQRAGLSWFLVDVLVA